jgi:hypothetical protein
VKIRKAVKDDNLSKKETKLVQPEKGIIKAENTIDAGKVVQLIMQLNWR